MLSGQVMAHSHDRASDFSCRPWLSTILLLPMLDRKQLQFHGLLLAFIYYKIFTKTRKASMSRYRAVFIAAFALLSATGCSTIADTLAAKGSGEARMYNASFDQVWNAVPEALRELGLREEGFHKGSGYVVARRQMVVGDKIPVQGMADNLAVFLDKGDSASRTRVEVVSKSTVPLNP
jgi:hypothetical protein